MIRILVLVLALAAGGAAAWLTFAARTPQVVAVAPKPVPMQEVLVAAGDLPQGQPLTKESLRWQPWPEQAVTPIYIRKSARPDALEKLTGMMVRSRFVTGEPIREDKLAATSAGFLAAVLRPGKRAVAVRVSAESSAGGFVLPGDRVDVLQTVSSNNGRSTRTILKNVTVLAVDQALDETAGKQQKPAVIGKTATLELDPPQAEVLIAAESGGSLSLVLRSVADNGEVVPPMEQQRRQAVRIFRAGRSSVVETQ